MKEVMMILAPNFVIKVKTCICVHIYTCMCERECMGVLLSLCVYVCVLLSVWSG